MNDLKCVKPIGEWDMALAEQIHADVQEATLEAAGVDQPTWNEAWSIVMTEGEHGPDYLDPEDMSIAKARSIVEKAVYGATFHNYPWENPDAPYGEGTCACPECDSKDVGWEIPDDGETYTCNDCSHVFTEDQATFHYEPNCCLDATTIRREVFAGWFRIYGGA